MTPKEQASYMVDKFTPHAYGVWDYNGSMEEKYHAKQCVLIAVNMILESNPTLINCDGSELNYAYWMDVKYEIQKIC
jgi:hypothetical protein